MALREGGRTIDWDSLRPGQPSTTSPPKNTLQSSYDDIYGRRVQRGGTEEASQGHSFLEGVGGFIKDTLVDPALRTAKHLDDIMSTPGRDSRLRARQQALDLARQEFLKQMKTVKPGSKEAKALAKKYVEATNKIEKATEGVMQTNERISKTDPRQVGAEFATTALTFLPGVGLAGKVAGGLGRRVATRAAEGAMIGAPIGTAQTLADDPDADFGTIARNTAIGAGLGGVLGGALPVAGAGLRKGAQATAPVREKIGEQLINQFAPLVKADREYAKAIGKSVQWLRNQGRSLEQKTLAVQNSGVLVDKLLAKELTVKGKGWEHSGSMKQLFEKYGDIDLKKPGVETENSFNNFLTLGFDRDTALVKAKIRNGKRTNPTSEISHRKLSDLNKEYLRLAKENPEWVKDAALIKKYSDSLVDMGVEHGLITKDLAKYVKNRYKHYAPIERLFDPEVKKLMKRDVSGGIRSNVSKQKIVQLLEGGDTPAVSSFSNIIARTRTAVSQAAKNDLSREVLRRQREGYLLGVGRGLDDDFLRDPARIAAKKELREKLNPVKDRIKSLNAHKRKLLGSKTEKEVLEKGSKSRIRALKRVNKELKEHRERRADLQGQLDEVPNIQSSTQIPTVKGMDAGEKFEIAVSNRIYRALEQDSRSPITRYPQADKLWRGVANGFKAFYTGVAAPTFKVMQIAANEGLIFLNNRALSAYGGRALGTQLLAFSKKNRAFMRELEKFGATPERFTKTPADNVAYANRIAAGKDWSSRMKYAKEHPWDSGKAVFEKMNRWGSPIENAQRLRIAKGSYLREKKRLLKQGVPDAEADIQAMRQAAYDFNNVLGDFNNVSKLARVLEPIFLYSGATQSGLRAVGRTATERPAEFATKATFMAAPMMGSAAYLVSSPEGRQYVEESMDGRTSNLDNYLTVPLPGFHKGEDGKWHNLLKVKLPPDVRPLMGMMNRAMYDAAMNNGEVDPSVYAHGLFNLATGGLLTGSDDPRKVDLFAAMEGSPIGELIGIGGAASTALNEKVTYDPETGRPITDPGEKFIDSIMERVGLFGSAYFRTKKNQKLDANYTYFNGLVDSLTNSLANQTIQSSVKTDGVRAFEAIEKLISKKDDKGNPYFDFQTVAEYRALHTFTDNEGDEDSTRGDLNAIFYSPKRAQALLSNPKLFELELEAAKINNKFNGKPIDPLLLIRSTAVRNAILSTQANPSVLQGTSNIANVVYDSIQYNRYLAERAKYYTEYNKWKQKQGYDVSAQTDPYPVASGGIQRKLDIYYTLSSSRAKNNFKKANPDLQFYQNSVLNWENRQRQKYTDLTGVPLEMNQLKWY